MVIRLVLVRLFVSNLSFVEKVKDSHLFHFEMEVIVVSQKILQVAVKFIKAHEVFLLKNESLWSNPILLNDNSL